jgi:Cdc6-like AAA superfamily ATPase
MAVFSSQECLRALSVSNPQVDIKEFEARKNQLLDNSCEWILENEHSREMLESDKSDSLWIHGLPGKGKTMIAAFLIDHLSKRVATSSGDCLAYFFCDSTNGQQNSTLHALKSILHQLLRQCPKNVLLDDFESQGPQMFSSIEAVWESLTRVLGASTAPSIFIVIDGLDECTKESLDVFLGLASTSFSSSKETLCNIK